MKVNLMFNDKLPFRYLLCFKSYLLKNFYEICHVMLYDLKGHGRSQKFSFWLNSDFNKSFSE